MEAHFIYWYKLESVSYKYKSEIAILILRTSWDWTSQFVLSISLTENIVYDP